MRGLVVEDNVTLRNSLGRSLEADGWQSEEVASVEEAMERVMERSFDLLVTDYNLGSEEDGLSLLRLVREKDCNLPVILMSGYGEKWLEDVAKEGGVFAFFLKPFPLEPFLESCRQARQEQACEELIQQRRAEEFL